MKIKTCLLFVMSLAYCAFAQELSDGQFRAAYGPKFSASPKFQPSKSKSKKNLDSVRRWNQIAIDACGLDHTPVAVGENREFGEQLGPGRSAYAMAIVHIAIF